jgi:hypothetical protein
LKKLARDYIEYSNRDIKVVIGIDIKYRNTKEATLSVWRPQYIHKVGEELDILEAKETITSQVCYLVIDIELKLTLRSYFGPPMEFLLIRPTSFVLLSTTLLRMKYRKRRTLESQNVLKYHTKSLRSFLIKLRRCKKRGNQYKGGNTEVLRRGGRHGSEDALQPHLTRSSLRMRETRRTRRKKSRTRRIAILVVRLSLKLVIYVVVALGANLDKLEHWNANRLLSNLSTSKPIPYISSCTYLLYYAPTGSLPYCCASIPQSRTPFIYEGRQTIERASKRKRLTTDIGVRITGGR